MKGNDPVFRKKMEDGKGYVRAKAIEKRKPRSTRGLWSPSRRSKGSRIYFGEGLLKVAIAKGESI